MGLKSHGYQPEAIYNNGIYVAGSVKYNKARIQDIIDVLAYTGWRVTYDWTRINQEKLNDNDAYRQQVIQEELWGIKQADAFVLVLPPGRGAHVELGYALALNKKIFILAQDPKQLDEVLIYKKASFTVCYSITELLQSLDRAAKWKVAAAPTTDCNKFDSYHNLDHANDPIPF